ncbi:MAG TPA: hypothetical protein VKR53_19570 [Puia sp.]|nr:hypothetical protein [Puia sp.]
MQGMEQADRTHLTNVPLALVVGPQLEKASLIPEKKADPPGNLSSG